MRTPPESTRRADDPTPVLGLTKAQLRPVVERMAGEPVDSFQVQIKHRIRGHHGFGGQKVIPTFAYRTSRGGGEISAFVKWCDDPADREQRNYAHLARLGAPVPEFYGSIRCEDRTTAMFVEHVETVKEAMPFRRFFANTGQLLGAVATIARFNAVKPDRKYRSVLDTGDCRAFMKPVPLVLDELWQRAAGGQLGGRMKSLCDRHRDILLRLKARPTEVAERVARMETGLCHRDFNVDCVGWRRGSNATVIFDLESVGLGPRFEDIADWCGAPAEVYLPCLGPRRLAGHYLRHYAQWGGKSVSVDAFLDEARTLWEFRALGMLWFSLARAVDGKVDFTADSRKGQSVYRRKLHADVRALLCRTPGRRPGSDVP